MRLKYELGVALDAVIKASGICLKAGSDAEAVQKEDRSPVTIADLGSQATIILEILASNRYEHNGICIFVVFDTNSNILWYAEI